MERPARPHRGEHEDQRRQTVADHNLFGVIIGAWPGSHCRRWRSPTGRRVRRWRSAPAPSRPAMPRPPGRRRRRPHRRARADRRRVARVVRAEPRRDRSGHDAARRRLARSRPRGLGAGSGPSCAASPCSPRRSCCPCSSISSSRSPQDDWPRGSPSRRSTARRRSSAPAARCSGIRSWTPTAGATAPTTSSSSTPTPISRGRSTPSGSASRRSSASRWPRSPSGGSSGEPPGRAALWSVLVPAALAATAEAAYVIALIRDPPEDPERGVFAASSSLARWPSSRWRPAWPGPPSAPPRAGRGLAARGRPRRGAGARDARAALARSLGDQSLEVAYRLPISQRYVDARAGRSSRRPARRTTTPIVRDGEPSRS